MSNKLREKMGKTAMGQKYIFMNMEKMYRGLFEPVGSFAGYRKVQLSISVNPRSNSSVVMRRRPAICSSSIWT